MTIPSTIDRWLILLAGSPLQRGCIALLWGLWILLPGAFGNPAYKYFDTFGPLVWSLIAVLVGAVQIHSTIRGSIWWRRLADGLCAVFFMTLSFYFLAASPTSTAVPVYGMIGVGSFASLVRERGEVVYRD